MSKKKNSRARNAVKALTPKQKFHATYYHFTTAAGTVVTISNGNAKLVPSKDIRFLIFSLPARKTCPHATKECAKKCYAFKEERYTGPKNSRNNNWIASLEDDFIIVMLNAIDKLLKRPSYKKAKKIYFRVHESGDFYSRAYWLKWIEIARICEKIYPQLIFSIYTKCIPFIVHSDNNFTAFTGTEYIIDDIPRNFVINASVWNDTDPVIKQIMFKLFRVYTAAERADMDLILSAGLAKECKCEDCGSCGICYTPYVYNDPTVEDTIVEIHD